MRKRGKRHVKQDKKMIYTVAAIFMVIFAALIGYLVYFTIFKQKEMSIHSQNNRLNNLESEVVRGKIYDATGDVVLAETDEEGNRVYPYGSLYAHAVGYSQSGKTGIEALANSELLYPNYSLTSILKMAFLNEKFQGRNVVTTLDHTYQSKIAEAMKGKRGGVVVIEATTGRIKAMYSNPTFDPNEIESNWTALNTDDENSPLLNRATKGLYPPGSIFKVITTLAYMRQTDVLDFEYNCTGSVSGDNFTIKCYNGNVHGKLDLAQAFAKSCNSYFVALGNQLPDGALRKAAESLGFNQALDVDFGSSVSQFNLQSNDSAFEKAATAIGQGRTLTTPLHMAMIASAIVNEGVCWKPYLIQYAKSDENGQVKDQRLPEIAATLMTPDEAYTLQGLMEGVLDFGTAVSLPEKNLVVGGKTGTAENETEADHSWFMGYAIDPDDESKAPIAFAVVVEGGGKGAQALTVSNSILEAYRSTP